MWNSPRWDFFFIFFIASLSFVGYLFGISGALEFYGFHWGICAVWMSETLERHIFVKFVFLIFSGGCLGRHIWVFLLTLYLWFLYISNLGTESKIRILWIGFLIFLFGFLGYPYLLIIIWFLSSDYSFYSSSNDGILWTGYFKFVSFWGYRVYFSFPFVIFILYWVLWTWEDWFCALGHCLFLLVLVFWIFLILVLFYPTFWDFFLN